jgi:formylglycine-generating enzyme
MRGAVPRPTATARAHPAVAALLLGCAEPAPPAAQVPAPAPAPAPAAAPPYPLVRIAPSAFTQGAPATDGAQGTDEQPHEVQITRAFLLGATEVPQALWQAVMGANPSHFQGPTRPVEQVSWCDAVDFANRMSAREGLAPAYSGVEGCAESAGASVRWDEASPGYRLPTEAEWEYAARAGEPHLYAGGPALDAVAWTVDNSVGQTHEVGQRRPNAWGLHDMSGNVWEWCWDAYGLYAGPATDPTQGAAAGPDRVNRGGSWRTGPSFARVSNRYACAPGLGDYDLGLRLARTAP